MVSAVRQADYSAPEQVIAGRRDDLYLSG